VANLRLSYVGRYSDNQLAPPMPVSSWTTLDASLAVPLHKLLSALGEDSRVQLVFDNIMNRAPPYAPTPLVPIGYDPVNADALGRFFGIEIVVRWGG
jgi:outer membrane receptor protein involved in Fe transport